MLLQSLNIKFTELDANDVAGIVISVSTTPEQFLNIYAKQLLYNDGDRRFGMCFKDVQSANI